MKYYKQLIKELPSKKVVFAFGRFQPPTTGHELLVNAVKKIAATQKADHVIFASRTQDKKGNPLPVDRKVYYLKRMFPNTNFAAANEDVRTFMEAAKALSKKYKNLVMVAGSDRVPEYKKLLDRYNGDVFHFDTVEVVSAGERDPDADTASGMSGTKMREAAKKNDFNLFKKGLPHSLTELDGKRLMNEIRQGLGLEIVKEQVKFETNELREKYYNGEIFNIGDKVSDGVNIFEVVDRGSNYITVVNEVGDILKKWLNAVQPIYVKEDIQPGPAPKQITYKGYTTKNFHHSTDAAKAFQDTIARSSDLKHDPIAILNALKSTDVYMGLNDKHLTGEKVTDKEKEEWISAHDKARESLNKIGEFAHHEDYWHMHQHELEGVLSNYKETGKEEFMGEQLKEMTIKSADKLKVARIIASSLGTDDVDEKTGAENLVNNALRKVKNKNLTSEAWKILGNMLKLATDANIKYDKSIIPETKFKVMDIEEELNVNPQPTNVVGSTLAASNDHHRKMKVKYKLGEEVEEELDMCDLELDQIINEMSDDDYLEVYEDSEFAIIDEDTGEFLSELQEDVILEVLSRAERIRAKLRFARSEAKRERKTAIALKTHSSTSTLNKRARRLAITNMKKRLAKKPLDKLSVAEKERLELMLSKRKKLIDRLAMRLVPKVKKTENDRLSNKKYTK